jgi:hypothetical protein
MTPARRCPETECGWSSTAYTPADLVSHYLYVHPGREIPAAESTDDPKR